MLFGEFGLSTKLRLALRRQEFPKLHWGPDQFPGMFAFVSEKASRWFEPFQNVIKLLKMYFPIYLLASLTLRTTTWYNFQRCWQRSLFTLGILFLVYLHTHNFATTSNLGTSKQEEITRYVNTAFVRTTMDSLQVIFSKNLLIEFSSF